MKMQWHIDFQLNMTFVKESNTTKYFKLVERDDTKIVFRVLNKCINVPYCDSFAVEEEWYFATPSS